MATVRIEIRDDKDQVIDATTTEMPMEVLQMALDAISSAYNYQATISNPDFVSSEETPKIEPIIDNPISQARFMQVQWRLFTEEHVDAYAVKQVDAAKVEALKQTAAAKAQIVVKEGI